MRASFLLCAVVLVACTPPAPRVAPRLAPPAPPAAPPPPLPPSPPGVPPRLALPIGVVVVHSTGGERRFKVEIAVSEQERQRGLMYREQLADDEGMLFVFEREQQLSFWMKNTWIPLDMVFITDDGRGSGSVLGVVENAEPMTTQSRSVPGKSRFVLELRGGLARELGIYNRHMVRFEGIDDALLSGRPRQERR